jgi:hypothetical protein
MATPRRKALPGMTRRLIAQLVKDSNLRGRGGAGFPTGVKWSLVPMDADAGTKYLLCNADEMEPGTFKDRLLMEQLPHQLIESMIIAAWAIQATRGYIFLRGEYVLAAERLQRAIAEAARRATWGRTSSAPAGDFELFVHTGAGRYICGEETALINSLEGRRANPRAKPPFPQIAGAWGKPTIVNNVETLCNVPAIVLQRRDWYKGLSRGLSRDSGTKLYGLLRRVKRPGLWELPIGTTRARDPRGTRRRHAGRLELKAGCPAVPPPTSCCPSTSTLRWTTTPSPRRQPHGHRPDHGVDRQHQHGVSGAQPGGVLRPRILRLVHALPRRPAVERSSCCVPSSAARHAPAISRPWSS